MKHGAHCPGKSWNVLGFQKCSGLSWIVRDFPKILQLILDCPGFFSSAFGLYFSMHCVNLICFDDDNCHG